MRIDRLLFRIFTVGLVATISAAIVLFIVMTVSLEDGSISVPGIFSTLLFGCIITLPVVVPVTILTIGGRVFLPKFLPIPEEGIALLLILSLIGLGFALLIMWAIGVDSSIPFGNTVYLATGIGGLIAGIMSSRIDTLSNGAQRT